MKHLLVNFFAHYQFIIIFEKKYFKKVQNNYFEKNTIFGLFGENRLWIGPPGGRVNIMADGNFLATYLKMGVDYITTT
jgi:hypothetical protein